MPYKIDRLDVFLDRILRIDRKNEAERAIKDTFVSFHTQKRILEKQIVLTQNRIESFSESIKELYKDLDITKLNQEASEMAKLLIVK